MWTVSSNDATIVRCIADIYVGGVFYVSVEKSPDIGQTDVFTFDVQAVLQDNLKPLVPSFSANINSVTTDQDSTKQYNIKFYEVLDNGTTYTTTWAADADEYFRRGIEVHQNYLSEPLVRTAFAPHAPYSVSDV